jgi:hypothetical protein
MATADLSDFLRRLARGMAADTNTVIRIETLPPDKNKQD